MSRHKKLKKLYNDLYYPEQSDLPDLVKDFFTKHPFAPDAGKGKWAYRFFNDRDSVLEVGCGRGVWIANLNTTGEKYGIDIVTPPETHKGFNFIEAPSWAIPLKSKSVDWVCSYAMLEHLYPEDVAPTLKEFSRVAKKGMVHFIGAVQDGRMDDFAVVKKSVYYPYHFCPRPQQWWIDKIIEHTEFKDVRKERIRQRSKLKLMLLKYLKPKRYNLLSWFLVCRRKR